MISFMMYLKSGGLVHAALAAACGCLLVSLSANASPLLLLRAQLLLHLQ
jgi:hypothetical protein